jgi:hypothetical protein
MPIVPFVSWALKLHASSSTEEDKINIISSEPWITHNYYVSQHILSAFAVCKMAIFVFSFNQRQPRQLLNSGISTLVGNAAMVENIIVISTLLSEK